jgi:hypothetical protein
MIDPRPVTDALLVILRAAGEPTGDLIAPPITDTTARWWVLKPTYPEPVPNLQDPENAAWMDFTLTSVARDPSTVIGRDGPRMDAQALDHKGRLLLLDRSVIIEGTGWRINGRRCESGATLRDGSVVNVNADYSFFIVPR